jgi:hypothetical protein
VPEQCQELASLPFDPLAAPTWKGTLSFLTIERASADRKLTIGWQRGKRTVTSQTNFGACIANTEAYFKNQIIQHQYVSQTTTTPKESNPIYESQQTFLDLLFGITVDDVSEMSLMRTTFSSLTNLLICRVLSF